MHDIEKFLRENSKYLSIRAIEKEIGCPTDTLQKVIQGRSIPSKWKQPVNDFFKRFCSAI